MTTGNITKKKAEMMVKFTDLMTRHKDDQYPLILDGWQIGILHGLIALVADHPGVQKLGKPTSQTIREVRGWCKNIFTAWGFGWEEVEYLDTMRDQNNPKITTDADSLRAIIDQAFIEEDHMNFDHGYIQYVDIEGEEYKTAREAIIEKILKGR
jgi:predicted RNA-binding protein with EMAP domain